MRSSENSPASPTWTHRRKPVSAVGAEARTLDTYNSLPAVPTFMSGGGDNRHGGLVSAGPRKFLQARSQATTRKGVGMWAPEAAGRGN